MTEHAIQVEVFRAVQILHHLHPEARLMFAIPNGGHRNKVVAAKLKAEGVKPGVPDIFLPVPRANYHGMWIEMKTEKGRLSPSQKSYREGLIEQGYHYHLGRAAGDTFLQIKNYLEL